MVRIMRYLKYTLNYELRYTRYPFVLREYNDVNLIFVTKDTKSMSDMSLCLVVQLYLPNLLNKHALQDSQWNRNLSLWIKQDKK